MSSTPSSSAATDPQATTTSPAPTPSSTTSPLPTTGEPDRFFGLSTAQVAGSSLAAATSALAASFLGVGGTIVGALVGSIVATVASAIYSHSFRRAGQRLRVLRPVPVSAVAASAPRVVEGPLRRDRRRSWPRVALGVVAGAVLALGMITGVEALLGHPVSDSSQRGTSVGEVFSGPRVSSGESGVKPSAPAATTPASPPTTATPPADQQGATPPGVAPTGTPTAPPTTAGPSATPTDPAPSTSSGPTSPVAPSPTAP